MWVYGWSGQIALIKWGRWLLDTLDRLLQTTALLHMRSIQQYMCRCRYTPKNISVFWSPSHIFESGMSVYAMSMIGLIVRYLVYSTHRLPTPAKQ